MIPLRTFRLRGVVLLGAAVTLAVNGCSKSAANLWPDKPGPRVMVSFPPLYCFTANVAGDDASVLSMLDASGVHEYRATPYDAIKLNQADLFIINGLDLDDQFAETLATNSGNKKLKKYEVAEEAIPKDKLRKMEAHEHKHGGKDGHAHAHQHGEYDPHVWLGLPEAILMVNFISDKLKEADPAHKDNYDKRAKEYTDKLKKLLADGQAKFKDKKEKKIISFHDSLGYFARAFGLEVVETIQPVAGEDASGKRIADLVELCKKEKVRVIAVEPNQMTNTAATALLAELKSKGIPDAQIVEVDVLESVPAKDLTPDYYERKMAENIEALAKALK